MMATYTSVFVLDYNLSKLYNLINFKQIFNLKFVRLYNLSTL
jgi:hypothetical protein